METNPQFSADLFSFTRETFKKKLIDLCSIKMNIKLQEIEVTHQPLHLLLLDQVHFP